MTRIYLSNKDISQLTGRNHTGINEKGERQGWPYKEVAKSGKPTKYYPIETLPDDIQISWVKSVVLNEELEALRFAMTLSERKRYYSKTSSKKRYDGKSQGLCKEALKIISGIQPETVDEERNSFPFVPLRAPVFICPECNYGEYKEKETENDGGHCLYCGAGLIDCCPECKESLCLPNQNFCRQGHQLRDNRAIPEHARLRASKQ